MTPDEIHESRHPSDSKSFTQPSAAGTLPLVDECQMNDRLNRCKRIEENREEELGPFSEAAKTPREWSLESQACQFGINHTLAPFSRSCSTWEAPAQRRKILPGGWHRGKPTDQGEHGADGRVGNALAGLQRVREAAKREKRLRFTALLHHASVALRNSFYTLKRGATPGVDGLTWQEYEADLDRRLEGLHSRVHRGT